MLVKAHPTSQHVVVGWPTEPPDFALPQVEPHVVRGGVQRQAHALLIWEWLEKRAYPGA